MEVKFGLDYVLIIGVVVVGIGSDYGWFGVNKRWLFWVLNANGLKRELFGFNCYDSY